MTRPNPGDVRLEVVDALFEATTNSDLSEDHLREIMFNATPDERRAVADRHYEHSIRQLARAQAQLYVWTQLWHRWCALGRDPDPAAFTIAKGSRSFRMSSPIGC